MKFYSLVVLGVLGALSSMSYARKPKKDLDIEMNRLVCPPGKHPAKIGLFCPQGAKEIPRDCWFTKVECVQRTLEDNEVTPEPREKQRITPEPPRKNWEEFDTAIKSLVCPPGKRPAKMGQFCPNGARNALDCLPTKVRCVQGALANDQATSEPTETPTTTPAPARKPAFSQWGGRFRAEPWSKAGQIGAGVRPWRTDTNENDPFRVRP